MNSNSIFNYYRKIIFKSSIILISLSFGTLLLLFLLSANYLEKKHQKEELLNRKNLAESVIQSFKGTVDTIGNSSHSVVALKYSDFAGYRRVVMPWVISSGKITGLKVVDNTGLERVQWHKDSNYKLSNASISDATNNQILVQGDSITYTAPIFENEILLGSVTFFSDINTLGLTSFNVKSDGSTKKDCMQLSGVQGLSICPFESFSNHGIWLAIIFTLSCFIAVVLVLKFLISNLSSSLQGPLVALNKGISDIQDDRIPNWGSILPADSHNVFMPLAEHISNASISIKEYKNHILITEHISNMAAQVSHDIRSPLAALNSMLTDLKELPEQKRVIVRSALQRINDISNSLLEKSKAPPAGSIPAQSAPSPLASTPAGAREVVLLSSMVGELLSEKRIQFREKMGVSIEEDLTKSYGYFASVNATELKRVLSNLINNSIEAFPEGAGRVTVGIRGYKDVVQIIVSDNGKGIPASVLAKLGERGVSHGKESSGTSGSGLGVYHAKSTVEAYGGKFEIQSREGQGTMIQIQLPRAVAPDWFVEELRLKPDMSVFSVDDDSSIHGIWSERLGAIGAEKQGVSLKSYTSAKAFVDICEGLAPEARANALFLVDYEFLNQGVNGLQIIEKLGVARQAILVTSRYDEVDIQKKCQGMGVKLIPKALAGYVPIVVG